MYIYEYMWCTYTRMHMFIFTYICMCANASKDKANRAKKKKKNIAELRISGSRPNDNCFLAMASAIHTFMHTDTTLNRLSMNVNTYIHI